VAHANARLTPAGRLILCQRIAAGRSVAQSRRRAGYPCTCPDRWWARYREAGRPASSISDATPPPPVVS
jgi:hypothetical protein